MTREDCENSNSILSWSSAPGPGVSRLDPDQDVPEHAPHVVIDVGDHYGSHTGSPLMVGPDLGREDRSNSSSSDFLET